MLVEIDNKIVSRAKKGDKEAFSKLYSLVYKDMYKYALFMLDNSQDAEDVVSETVLDAYRTIHKLRREDLFRNWIFKILSNKCKMRREQYIKKEVELEEKHSKENVDVIGKCDIEISMNKLEDDERKIIAMSVFAGYKSREIGEILKMPSGTVRSKMSRALDKMQNMMKGYEFVWNGKTES